VGRFIVGKIWKPFQIIGVRDPTRPAKNFEKRAELEKEMTEWVNDNKGELDLLVVGHTHRPYLPEVNETPYCNTGSCVHPRCITGIEIENGEIRLIEWFIDVNPVTGGTLFVNRKTLEGPRKFQEFL
jgi:UDP-2,3-diacylglucosamine pyrophosphatase LpxH